MKSTTLGTFKVKASVDFDVKASLAQQLRDAADLLDPIKEAIVDAEIQEPLSLAVLQDLPPHSHVTTEDEGYRVWRNTASGLWQSVGELNCNSLQLTQNFAPVYLLTLGRTSA